MCDEEKIVEEVTNLFCGTLIVGNHDSITLYGIHTQNALKDYARRVASILLNEAEKSEPAISELLQEMERFEGAVNRPKVAFLRIKTHQKEVRKEYRSMLAYIERVSQYCKLQQTQLVKEVKLFDYFSKALTSTTQELESCIEQGKTILKSGAMSSNADIAPEDRLWYTRLSQRIEDLSVSHTISLQSQAQIKVLQENDLRHLDQLANILSNTLPAWQSQMALALGVDLLRRRQNMQASLLDAGEKHIVSFLAKKQHKGELSQNMDAEHILQINLSLKKVLDELVQTETVEDSHRKAFLTESYQSEGRDDHAN